jgi:hypothetical protein
MSKLVKLKGMYNDLWVEWDNVIAVSSHKTMMWNGEEVPDTTIFFSWTNSIKVINSVDEIKQLVKEA